MENRLIIFDGNAILHRAYHAMPKLTNYKGEHIEALYGMISILVKTISDLRPTHIIFCFDEEGENFRHKILKTYQENRSHPDDDLISQIKKAPDLINAIGIPVYSHNGFEADDLIGTIAKKAVEDTPLVFGQIVVVTGDRDLLQLVDDRNHISLFMPQNGMTQAVMYDEEKARQRMGVLPSQIADLKGLVGDMSDNYKGVPGIGPKTACSLLAQFGSFSEIYKNLEKIPEKIRNKLIEGCESGELSYKLAQIVTDVDIVIDFDKASKWDLVSREALAKYEEIGFRSLVERIKKTAKEISKKQQTSLF
ncbi:MAG: 5'-3' exonuclease [Patescibacteria group bacterium]|nr:5'-3' exonuclease [Patescibacteria group bacterium]